MAKCKCRYCQEGLLTQNAFKVTDKKKNAYFCNEEHYKLFLERVRQRKEEENAQKLLAVKRREEREAAEREEVAKRKADKDKAYWLICEIIGRKEIINTVLWKEWAIWNKVATNEIIGKYLDENKNYLMSVVSKLDNLEYARIKYLSAIIKNNLGDYKIKAATVENKQKIKVDDTFYQPVATKNNRRRSLADLEDEF